MKKDSLKEAIHNWFHLYSDDIYNYIFLMINDHYQAKDLTQDTFLRAYNNLQKFGGNNARGWLFRIARNLTIDYVRKEKGSTLLTKKLAAQKSLNKTTEQLAALNESESELYEALNNLKQSYRDVIILRKIKGFSIIETSEILGWSQSKVKSTLQRGLKELKKQMVKGGFVHETV